MATLPTSTRRAPTRPTEPTTRRSASGRASLTILSAGPDGSRIAQEAADRHDEQGIGVRAVGATGEPARALVDEARRGGYDLLVTGNKGLSGVYRLAPVGKVPAKVAHHLPCSLLVVKTT